MNNKVKTIEKMDWTALVREYGVDGKRLLPWDSVALPFGGSYCVVRAKTSSLAHVNEPKGEQEMFICIKGAATVYIGLDPVDVNEGDVVFIPAGANHYVDNTHVQDFHMYSIWWDANTVKDYVNKKEASQA